jgi:hypothetical protein
MAIYYINKWLRYTLLKGALAIALILMVLDPFYFVKYMSKDNNERNIRIENARFYKNIKQYIPDTISLVMNTNAFEDIDIMFYNNDITAYQWTLSQKDMDSLRTKKVPIAVVQDRLGYSIPEFMYTYPYLFVIDYKTPLPVALK